MGITRPKQHLIWRQLGPGNGQKKLARYLDKAGAIPQYGLQHLRYYLDPRVEVAAHDAFGDILVLERLFKRIYTRFEKDGLQDPH
jgi:hypothetical protein